MPKEEDRELLRPTIVGGQPSAANNQSGSIPRGMEALIKKAAVDPEFRQVLLEKRADAAHEIDLELTVGEAGMLSSIPRSHIEQIIDKTTVPNEHRRVFLGKVGAAMLAVLSMDIAALATAFGEDAPPARPVPPGSHQWLVPVVPSNSKVKAVYIKGTRPGRQKPYPGPIPMARPPAMPFKIKKEPVIKANRGKQLLGVKVVDSGPGSVSVSIEYSCPFERATIMIVFEDKRRLPCGFVGYTPAFSNVSKGSGTVTFRGLGMNETTDWLVVRLRSTESRCAAAATPRSLNPYLKQYKPQEYLVDDCSVWRIVKFHKEWKSKG
jgi:hypothetical protein